MIMRLDVGLTSITVIISIIGSSFAVDISELADRAVREAEQSIREEDRVLFEHGAVTRKQSKRCPIHFYYSQVMVQWTPLIVATITDGSYC